MRGQVVILGTPYLPNVKQNVIDCAKLLAVTRSADGSRILLQPFSLAVLFLPQLLVVLLVTLSSFRGVQDMGHAAPPCRGARVIFEEARRPESGAAKLISPRCTP